MKGNLKELAFTLLATGIGISVLWVLMSMLDNFAF